MVQQLQSQFICNCTQTNTLKKVYDRKIQQQQQLGLFAGDADSVLCITMVCYAKLCICKIHKFNTIRKVHTHIAFVIFVQCLKKLCAIYGILERSERNGKYSCNGCAKNFIDLTRWKEEVRKRCTTQKFSLIEFYYWRKISCYSSLMLAFFYSFFYEPCILQRVGFFYCFVSIFERTKKDVVQTMCKTLWKCKCYHLGNNALKRRKEREREWKRHGLES